MPQTIGTGRGRVRVRESAVCATSVREVWRYLVHVASCKNVEVSEERLEVRASVSAPGPVHAPMAPSGWPPQTLPALHACLEFTVSV